MCEPGNPSAGKAGKLTGTHSSLQRQDALRSRSSGQAASPIKATRDCSTGLGLTSIGSAAASPAAQFEGLIASTGTRLPSEVGYQV